MRRSFLSHLALVALVLGTGLAIGLGVSEAPGSQPAARQRPPERPAPVAVSAPPSTANPAATTSISAPPSVTLPTSYTFDGISVVDGDLLLSGEVASTSSSLTPTCVSATVDPATLALGPAIERTCDDPAVSGQSIGMVNAYIPASNNATISISTRDPKTGDVSVGPVVMTYGSYSDTRPVTAYGGGWLWIYDNSVIEQGSQVVNVSNPGVAELLQISPSTGQVVDSVPMPTLYRPLMAANDEGLWIGNSINGAQSASALYFVASGSSSPQVVIAPSTTVVCWLTGNGDVLWAGVNTRPAGGCQSQTIERFDGTNPQPVFQVPDQGYHPVTVIGDEAQGLWTVQWSNPSAYNSLTSASPQEVVNIDPDTGAEQVVAMLPSRAVPISHYGGLSVGQAVIFEGSMYLLEPPFLQGSWLGYSSLVRVRLH